jgi:flagellin-like protein
MNHLSSNRKAVSPVIASVLMILITMIGMTLLFAFVTTYSDNYKAGVGSSVMESITVENIWLSPNSTNYDNTVVQISLYNTGKVDSLINSIYVNGSALVAVGSASPNFGLKIPVGWHLQVLAQWPRASNWISNSSYTFKITTQRGSNFEVNYVAP